MVFLRKRYQKTKILEQVNTIKKIIAINIKIIFCLSYEYINIKNTTKAFLTRINKYLTNNI